MLLLLNILCADWDYWTNTKIWLSCCCSCQHVGSSIYQHIYSIYHHWNRYLSPCYLACTFFSFFSEAHNSHISPFFFSFPNNTLIMTKAYFKDDFWICISSVMSLLLFMLMIWLKRWLYYRWTYPLLSRRAVTKETYSKRNMTGDKLQPHQSYTHTHAGLAGSSHLLLSSGNWNRQHA